tara:strand:+ start:1112 stop:2854 length:1743 start_codon:yes stop_codon:yes gene_type:complete
MPMIREKPIFRLFKLLSKKRKRQLYLLMFLLILNGIFEFFSIASVVPFLTIATSKNQINNIPIFGDYIEFLGINNHSQLFFVFTLLFCLFITSSVLLRLFNISYISRICAKLTIDISYLIVKNNLYQSYYQYTKRNSSQIISLATEKVTAASSAMNALLTVLASSILSISIIFSLLVLKWEFTLIGIIFLLNYYLLVYKKVKQILFKNGQVISEVIPMRLKILNEAFQGFRDIKINGNEKIYINLFKNYDSKLKLSQASSDVIITFPRILMEGIILLILTLVGYKFGISDNNPVSYIPLIGSFVFALQKLAPLTQQIYTAWASYKYKSGLISNIVNDIEENNFNEENYLLRKNITFEKEIILKNVNYSYDKSRNVLEDINFRINKGEIIGIFGKTGSGKSTFLDIIMGLLTPTKGEVIIDNKVVNLNKSKYNWTSNIVHVPQNIFLKEGTIAENIAFGDHKDDIDFKLLVKASKVADIYSFIKKEKNGFKTIIGERGINLSGGQKQRIAIARAIYKARNILILDEATSALDELTETKVLNAIFNLDHNLTVIMVTHRMKSLALCSRVLTVVNKKIIEQKS